jgi:hypothetical protein
LLISPAKGRNPICYSRNYKMFHEEWQYFLRTQSGGN